MASDKEPQKEIDRWRRMLSEVERELEDKTTKWSRLHELYSATMVKFTQTMGATENTPLKKAVVALQKVLEKDIDIVKVESTFAHLTHALLQWNGETAPTRGKSASSLASDQLCAMLISEILLQLLESVGLPAEVGHRIERLKQTFDVGLQNGRWDDMYDEVANMATDIKVKINLERSDTETFLKQVTDRLQELDSYMSGAQKHRSDMLQSGQTLDDAVRQEMRNLQSGVDETADIAGLKKVVQHRLSMIETHFNGFHARESQRHNQENEVIKALKTRLKELEAETRKLQERIQQERMAAQMDALTGVPNRLGFQERIAQEYARWKRFKNPLTLVVWDIDHFKKINDGYGHAVGDRVLKAVAKLLQAKIRETDFIARYGGEEFVLIMPGATRDAAKSVAEKLRAAVAESDFHFKGEPVKVTISCGVAEFENNDTVDTVFERSDEALYKAKEQGRNRVIVAK